MIAQVKIQTQYGQDGQAGPPHLFELDEEPCVAYAHSAQDALEWVKTKPLYENAVIDPISDGYVIYSHWVPYDNMEQIFETNDVWRRAKYFRHCIKIGTVNTLYENSAYK